MPVDPLDPAAVEAVKHILDSPRHSWTSCPLHSRAMCSHREAFERAAAYLDRSGLAEGEAEIKAMFAEAEQRLIAKVDELGGLLAEARASLELAHNDLDDWVRRTGEAVSRAQRAEAERDEMRKANITPEDADRPLGQSVEYWQDRTLDHATAYDEMQARATRAERDLATAREALKVAADDLDKAANQFEALKQGYETGHPWPVVQNPRTFAEKAARARAVLAGDQHSENTADGG